MKLRKSIHSTHSSELPASIISNSVGSIILWRQILYKNHTVLYIVAGRCWIKPFFHPR